MTAFYIILLLLVPGKEAEPICCLVAEKVPNQEICQEKADGFNDEAPVMVTADGSILITRAFCDTEI